MNEFLKSGEVGQIQLNEQKAIKQKICSRWDALGMTEGLKGAVKENVAVLFENEAKQLLSEANTADNSGSFETVVFPIIRRVFSKLLANDIVSVQAMNLPIGKVFFMLPVTSEREFVNVSGASATEADLLNGNVVGRHKGLMGYERTDRRNGAKYNRFYLPDEVVAPMTFNTTESGSTTPATFTATSYDEAIRHCLTAATKLEPANLVQTEPTLTKFMGKTLYDLFYNDFLYDNSKGKVRIQAADVKSCAFVNGQLVEASAATEALKEYTDATVRNLIVKVTGFEQVNAGKLTGPDGNEMDTEAFLASLKIVTTKAITDIPESGSSFGAMEEVPYRVVTQKYGKAIVERDQVADAEGCIYLDLDLAKPVNAQGLTIDGYLGVRADKLKSGTTVDVSLFKAVWAQYDSLELETEMGEVGFELTSAEVSVQARKLRATWSPELSQDVSAFQNIDAEAELTALLSEQIAAEIDREILRDLRHAAPWTMRWDHLGWRKMAGYSTNYTQKDWNQELMTCINQISAQIHKATLRGGANFIVVSSEVSAVFDNLEYFHVSDASAEQDQYNMGIEKVGSLQSRYNVYRDPYSPANSIIIGHKGKSLLETGYIYAPYIPMQLTPTIINPENFAPIKGIMTRYAKKVVNNRFFGQVKVDGLRQFDINELR